MGIGELEFFLPSQLLIIQEACSILAPFEEATRIVSHDKVGYSDTIHLLPLLEHILHGLIDRILEGHQQEEEDGLLLH